MSIIKHHQATAVFHKGIQQAINPPLPLELYYIDLKLEQVFIKCSFNPPK